MQRHSIQIPSRRARAALVSVAAVLALGAAACGSDTGGTNDSVVPSGTVEINTQLTPAATTAGSGPLDSYETDTSGSDGTVLGDPMQPSTNDSSVIVSP